MREAVASGRISNEEEAVRQALWMWEDRERQRVEILAAVGGAQASITRGEGRRIASEEELQQFADDFKSRGMARLAAGQNRRLTKSGFRPRLRRNWTISGSILLVKVIARGGRAQNET